MKLPKTGELLLGKYLLEKRLGEGGMGVVYAARHELLHQRVAVKLIRPAYAGHEDAVKRFINEARSAARIDNEHVARVLDVGMLDDGLPYMVLEYLEGIDLADALRERGPMPIADVADDLGQAIEAIAHAHALGIIHRDLKPSNIFLACRPDGTSRVKVLDFGISKMMDAVEGQPGNLTATNSVLGSPLYMSPEQLRDAKSVDQRSDIWALGVVAYELLTGRLPFKADNMVAHFAAIQESAPTSVRVWRSDVPEELDAVIMKCLQRRAEDRFASVTELAFALAPFGTNLAKSAYESSKRILPLASANSPSSSPTIQRTPSNDEARPSEKFDPPVSSTLPGLPLENATAPQSRSQPVITIAPRSHTTTILGLALVGALAVVAGLLLPRLRPPPPLTQALAEPPPPAPLPPLPTPSLSLAPASASAPASAPASASASASASAPAKPRPTPVSPPRATCNPPYDFDTDGKKIWKRECL